MKNHISLNAISVLAGSAAIAVACKVTKSAYPLLAFLIIPRWNVEIIEQEEQNE